MDIAVILGLLVAIFYGVGTFFAKIVCEKNPLFQWIVVNIVGIILSIFIIIKYKVIITDQRIIMYAIISAILVVVGSLILYYALYKGKASIVVPISSIGPAITIILSILFLKESLTTTQMIGVFLILAGIILLSISE
ncbi:EamA domain-containing protein [Methanocaldococcus lauensis]|uniref:EamA domain-containing protein n=1 Tax=Methanocaldococcus lauensis TaxID=2546128 RepID=A0A8D6SVS9_9EURY|nr:EamA family transporter [Methanocaldococcus lauensis]CAB3290081.1 EamA domain-containing protein [Methanocaldococcus lauensis]